MQTTAELRILFMPDKRDHAGMNYLKKNVTYLMGARNLANAQALAEAAGPSYSTIYRILNDEDYSPGSKTLDQLAAFFAVPLDDLRRRDITDDPRFKRELVHIHLLDGFEIPRGPLYDRYHSFDDPIVLPRSWFQFNVGTNPDKTRFAVKRNESNRGELDIGNIAIVDLEATSVEEWGPGLYAYSYFGVSDIKRISIPRPNAVRISGSKEFLDSVELEGKELEGLVIHGKVVSKLAHSRL